MGDADDNNNFYSELHGRPVRTEMRCSSYILQLSDWEGNFCFTSKR